MIDIAKPLAYLFILLGIILFGYGQFFSDPVELSFKAGKVMIKLNQPVGLFMFLFGMVAFFFSKYMYLKALDTGLKDRKSELGIEDEDEYEEDEDDEDDEDDEEDEEDEEYEDDEDEDDDEDDDDEEGEEGEDESLEKDKDAKDEKSQDSDSK